MAYSACCLGRGLSSLRGSLCCLCRMSVSPCVFPSFEFSIMFLVAGSFWIRYSFRYTVLTGWIKSFLLLIPFLLWSCWGCLCNSWCLFVAIVVVFVIILITRNSFVNIPVLVCLLPCIPRSCSESLVHVKNKLYSQFVNIILSFPHAFIFHFLICYSLEQIDCFLLFITPTIIPY